MFGQGNHSMLPDLRAPLAQRSMPNLNLDEIPMTNARDVFPAEQPKRRDEGGPRPHFQKLMNAPQSQQRDDLLVRYIEICDEVDRFLNQTKLEKQRALEAERAQAYTACGVAWQNLQNCQSEVNRVTARLSHHQMNQLSAARAKAAEAEQKNFGTPYPSAEAVGAWERKRSAAKAELAAAIQDQQNLEAEIRFAGAAAQQAHAALRQRQQELDAVDQQLNGFQ
jgi:hypothetical protein